MITKGSHEEMELASTSPPPLTRFRNRLLEADKFPLEDYDSDDPETGQNSAHKRKKKKKKNNLIVMGMLLA